MDCHLSMDAHIKAICKKSYFHLRNLSKIRRYLSKDAQHKIVHAFISSNLDCNNALLYGLPKYQTDKLQRIQNSSARLVTRTKKQDHITPVLKSLHWLPVQSRIIYKILTLTYRCLHQKAPEYLTALIHPHNPPRNLRSSTSLLLDVPRSRLSHYGDWAFSVAGPRLWNRVPDALKSAASLDTFKINLKTYLFNNKLEL